MYYTIYEIRNKLNGKIYVGKHQTENINDLYYGSGKAISNAIKLHGKDNFEKTVLFVFDTEEEMNTKEIEIITEEFVSRSDTYNLGVGGEGGAHFKGKKHSEETIKQISNSVKSNGVKPPSFKGKKHSEESLKKIGDANRLRTGLYVWITNEVSNKRIKKIDPIPEGWRRGRKTV